MIEAHTKSDALATITLTSVEDPSAYGLVEVDYRMRVERFVEKPGEDGAHASLINAGVYVLEPQVLSMIPEGREVSMEREIFPQLQAMGRLQAYVSSAYWRDIGTPRGYLAASHDVLSGTVGRREDFRFASVHPSASISKDVALLPPVDIDEGCEIAAGATVGCRVGEESTIEGSILFEGVQVEEWPLGAWGRMRSGERGCLGPRSQGKLRGRTGERGADVLTRTCPKHGNRSPGRKGAVC